MNDVDHNEAFSRSPNHGTVNMPDDSGNPSETVSSGCSKEVPPRPSNVNAAFSRPRDESLATSGADVQDPNPRTTGNNGPSIESTVLPKQPSCTTFVPCLFNGAMVVQKLPPLSAVGYSQFCSTNTCVDADTFWLTHCLPMRHAHHHPAFPENEALFHRGALVW